MWWSVGAAGSIATITGLDDGSVATVPEARVPDDTRPTWPTESH
jgi:hypothetical protein